MAAVLWGAAAGAAAAAEKPAVVLSCPPGIQGLAQAAAALFQAQHRDLSVTLRTAASNSGVFRDLMTGASQLGLLTRPPKPREELMARQKGLKADAAATALEALVFVVHPAVTVTNLSTAQIRGLYEGHLTNWSEVGGADLPVTVVAQGPNSDMHEIYAQQVAEAAEAAAPSTVTVADSAAACRVAAATPGAVAYAGAGALTGVTVRVLAVDGVEPSPAAVAERRYPHRRGLFLVSTGEAGAGSPAAQFRAFLASAPVRELLAQHGFIVPVEPPRGPGEKDRDPGAR